MALFGSLLHEDMFNQWSDVDIAAWGIAPTDTFKAAAALLDFDGDIEVNLVDVGMCRPALLALIEWEGVEL